MTFANLLNLRQTSFLGCLAMVFFLVIGPVVAIAGETNEPIATLSEFGSGLYWTPHVEYEHITLTVSGPGDLLIRREFDARAQPYLADSLPDGQYTYELSAAPFVDPKVRSLMREAREAGDDPRAADLRSAGLLPEPIPVQSGSFAIRNGAMVNPNAVE